MSDFKEYHKDVFEALKNTDGQVFDLIKREYERVETTLQLIAAENICSRAVLGTLGTTTQNKTAEGFAGKRCHAGCEVIDDIEELANERAKKVFGARYANVQPYSGTQANQIVFMAVLEKGDRILSMALEQGGHFSHGTASSFAGKFFTVKNYGVDKESYRLDYGAVRQMAIEFKPKLIICGASFYPRQIDFKKFREIADEIGAYLLADVSHITGLIIAGAHMSPVGYAHFTNSSTYKPGGPRGGLVLMGNDYELPTEIRGQKKPLWEHIQDATFPGVQGTAYFNQIAAKAVFFKEACSQEFRDRQFAIIKNAQKLASCFMDLGYDVLTNGTDNHMLLVNVMNLREGLTGVIAQKGLEECGIETNVIGIPYAPKGMTVAGGLRLGTPIVTKRGMGAVEMEVAANMIDAVLKEIKIVNDTEYELDESFKNEMRNKVKDLCGRFVLA